jgi:hypothetical protein
MVVDTDYKFSMDKIRFARAALHMGSDPAPISRTPISSSLALGASTPWEQTLEAKRARVPRK